MKKTILFLIPFVLIIQNIISMKQGGFNMTGAPGEGNCTGCHTGVANSDPNGTLNISISGNPNFYKPDSVYELLVTSAYQGKTRFGFGLNARKKGIQFIGVGEFQADSLSELRIYNDFVTHTDSAIDELNSKTWKVKWKAPAKNQGIVTFYAATVIGNADDNNIGDVVVTDSLSIGDIASGIINNAATPELFTLGVNQTPVVIQTSKTENYTVNLYTLNGNLVSSYQFNQQLSIEKNTLNTGIYLIQVSNEKNQTTKKVMTMYE